MLSTCAVQHQGDAAGVRLLGSMGYDQECLRLGNRLALALQKQQPKACTGEDKNLQSRINKCCCGQTAVSKCYLWYKDAYGQKPGPGACLKNPGSFFLTELVQRGASSFHKYHWGRGPASCLSWSERQFQLLAMTAGHREPVKITNAVPFNICLFGTGYVSAGHGEGIEL